MEDLSTKQTEAYKPNTSQLGESHSMSTLNHPAPPPPYQESTPQHQNHQYPAAYPHPRVMGQNPGVVVAPVAITHQPGVTVVHSVPTRTTMVGNTVVQTTVVEPMIGPLPSVVHCPSCRHQIVTRVEYNPNFKTHFFALAFCLVGCWPCVCIPYCTPTCQSASHHCTNCGAFIGSTM